MTDIERRAGKLYGAIAAEVGRGGSKVQVPMIAAALAAAERRGAERMRAAAAAVADGPLHGRDADLLRLAGPQGEQFVGPHPRITRRVVQPLGVVVRLHHLHVRNVLRRHAPTAFR